MKITITRDAGLMIVDNEARPVNVSLLAAGIEAVFFDTNRNEGFIQYKDSEEEEIEDRDLEGEEEENRRRKANNLRELEEPMYKKFMVRKRPRRITVFTQFEPLLAEWEVYVPPPKPGPDPEFLAKLEAVKAEREADRTDSMGTVQPATFEELSNMRRAELRTWFDANVTGDVHLRRIVKWMFIYLIRRF